MRLSEVLAKVTPHVLPTLWRHGSSEHCCVAAARLMVVVLKDFGFEANPLPTARLAWNQAEARYLKNPDTCTADDRDKCWSDSTGASGLTADGSEFFGNMVVEVNGLLVDAAIALRHPETGIRIPPVIVPITSEFWSGGWLKFTPVADIGLAYRLMLGDRSFRNAPAWLCADHPTMQAAVHEVIESALQEQAPVTASPSADSSGEHNFFRMAHISGEPRRGSG